MRLPCIFFEDQLGHGVDLLGLDQVEGTLADQGVDGVDVECGHFWGFGPGQRAGGPWSGWSRRACGPRSGRRPASRRATCGRRRRAGTASPFGNGRTASRMRSMATSMSNGDFIRGLGTSCPFSNAAHDRLDVGLLDRQVVQRIAGGDCGDQLGGGRLQAIELQPAARTVGAHFGGAAHLEHLDRGTSSARSTTSVRSVPRRSRMPSSVPSYSSVP